MSKRILRDPLENPPVAPEARQRDLPIGEHRHADAEMKRVLKTAPLRMASDPLGGAIAHWMHEPVHDVVGPMADHVVMTFPTGLTQFERRSGKSVVTGTVRPG